MASASKTKGSTFERDIAKELNKLFDTNEFARTFGSGAFVGKSNWNKRSGLSTDLKNALAGDIIVPNWFPFNIECKNYQDSPVYHNILTSDGDKTLDGWLGKSIHDSINTKTLPIVIFKTTRKGVFVALHNTVSHYVNCENYANYKTFMIMSLENFKPIIQDIIETMKQSPDSVPLFYEKFEKVCLDVNCSVNKLYVNFKDN